MLTKAEEDLKEKISEMLLLKDEIREKTRRWKKLRKEIHELCGAWTYEEATQQLLHLIKK